MLIQLGDVRAICGACGQGGSIEIFFTVDTPCGDQVGVRCGSCGGQFAAHGGRRIKWVRQKPVPQDLHAEVHARLHAASSGG